MRYKLYLSYMFFNLNKTYIFYKLLSVNTYLNKIYHDKYSNTAGKP